MPQDETQPAEKLDYRLVKLAQDLANAKTPAEIAKHYAKQGVDPRYLAMRYLPEKDHERFIQACEAWKARQGKDA